VRWRWTAGAISAITVWESIEDGHRRVTRYLGRYGSGRVRKAALLGAIPPFLLKRGDNPEGADGQVFEDIKSAIVKDRYAYFKDFRDNFYNSRRPRPHQRAGLPGQLQRRRRRLPLRDLRVRRYLVHRLPQ
jgi:hypothetical protein